MEEKNELDALREELSALTVSFTQDQMTQHILNSLARIEAQTYLSALNTSKILAHLKEEDLDEAKKKLNNNIDRMTYKIVISTLKGFQTDSEA